MAQSFHETLLERNKQVDDIPISVLLPILTAIKQEILRKPQPCTYNRRAGGSRACLRDHSCK